MFLIKNLKNEFITDLTEITDAQFEGDPDGTNANAAYFESKVHNYLKDIGIALQPENTKFVNYGFTGENGDLGDPFFRTVHEAYQQIKSDPDSGESNKVTMLISNKGTTYNDDLVLDETGYVILEGFNKYGTVISGSVVISAGTHIFRNIKFTNSITIDGGTAVFENCQQTSGETTISNASTVIITKCEVWGNVRVTADINDTVNLWCEDVLYMKAVEMGPSLYSLILPSTLTNQKIVLRRIAAEGEYSDPGNLITEISGFESNVTARPII